VEGELTVFERVHAKPSLLPPQLSKNLLRQVTMGDIWSYSFRSHIDRDSEDEEDEDKEEKEEGKGGGEEQQKLMSREEEELSLLDLGGRADESQLVIKETPWQVDIDSLSSGIGER